MPTFKVLFITEFCLNNNSTFSKESDHKIAILYDESECNFYYYGTRLRKTDIKKKYIEYSGSYSHDAFQNFHDFLKYLLDGDSSLITNELFEINISKNEYANLSFSKLNAKFCDGALLSAYDRMPNTGMYLDGLLRMLITN